MLYFNIQNFRVFKEDTILDMRAKKRLLKYKENLIDQNFITKTKTKSINLIPYAVIFGGNASGKSSIIKALDLLKDIVIDGRIYSDNRNETLFNLGLYPFLHNYEDYLSPMKLSIGFISNNIRYDYSVKIKCKLREEYFYADRKICEEQLFINEQEVFHRTNQSVEFEGTIKSIGTLPEDEHISNDELFLNARFKTGKYYQDYQNIVNWFRFKLIVLNNVSEIITYIESNNLIKQNKKIRSHATDLTKDISDFGPQSIFYEINSNSNGVVSELRSRYAISGHPCGGIETSADDTESTGTIKFVNIIGLLIDALRLGNTVVIDELDSSLHFALIKKIVNLFARQSTNIGKGQLIFTSHNPVFISLTNIRRDQIYFVEKDNKTFASSLYSLSDFPSEDVRTSEAFIKNYLDGKYGAQPNFDFEGEIEKIINAKKDNQ